MMDTADPSWSSRYQFPAHSTSKKATACGVSGGAICVRLRERAPLGPRQCVAALAGLGCRVCGRKRVARPDPAAFRTVASRIRRREYAGRSRASNGESFRRDWSVLVRVAWGTRLPWSAVSPPEPQAQPQGPSSFTPKADPRSESIEGSGREAGIVVDAAGMAAARRGMRV